MIDFPAKTRRLPLTTLATSLGFMLVQLDVSIVNVGLARIAADLGMGMAGLEWVVDAYTLAFASLMLSAGALGDRLGARCGFISGFAVFAAASVACGLAPGPAALIAARTVQGCGAAWLMPTSLALLNHACQGDSRARAQAVGVWTSAGAVSLAAGPVLGGLMIEWFGWRSLFLVNLPLGVAGIWMALRWVEETPRGEAGLDPLGQVLGCLALFTLTGGVIEGGATSWQATRIVALLVVAILAGAAFLGVEAKGRRPMLPLGFFRQADFSSAAVVGFVVNFTLYGAVFVFNLFLQRLAGYSATASGIAFLPVPAVLFVANIGAGVVVAKVGSRLPMAGGLPVAAAGFVLLSKVTPETPWIAMLPGLVVMSGGIGTAVPAMTTALLGSVPGERAGIASGVLNTIRQAGGAMGVAVFGSLLAGQGIAGMHQAYLWAAGLCAGAGLVAFIALGRVIGAETRIRASSGRRA